MTESIEVAPELRRRQEILLITPSDLKAEATKDIAGAMNAILADVFALYLKTKNFHWQSGPHFRDYHLLLDEQGRPTLRHDRPHRGTHPQAGRDHAEVDRPYGPLAACIGQ